MRAVIIGAGKVGCGYLAPLFRAGGHEVVLACQSPETAAKIRSADGWRVAVTGSAEPPYEVHGVAPVAVGTAELDEAVAEAELIAISVGVNNVASAVAHIAPGLAARRERPIDVWLVENGDCASAARAALERAARDRGLSLPPVGLAGAVASVAVARGSWWDDGVPEFVGDAVRCMAVDGAQLLMAVPNLPGVDVTSRYRARLCEKLFVFNAGHALTAYLGWLRGHDTVDSAIVDPFVRPIVAGALLEALGAVLAAYPGLVGGRVPDLTRDIHQPVARALARYGDKALADPISRVGREPLRKLAPGDRLLGPVALLRMRSDVVPAHFALGIAAAMLYGYDDGALLGREPQAAHLRRMLEQGGVAAVLDGVCGLDPRDRFAQAVAKRYHGFVFTDDGVRFPPAAPDPLPEGAS